MAEPLTRVEMAAIIDGGTPLVFNGVLYTNSADLPTQEEIDAIYSGGFSATVDTSDLEALLGAGLPAALGTGGGVKVSIVDGGGGSGGGGLTDAELRATPVEISDAGASITVDGTVSVSNFPATQPVSGTVSVGNFPATQPVSAASLPLPTGASTSANQATTHTKLDGISAQLPAALSSGALKVDIVGNTAAVGGAGAPAPVAVWTSQVNASTTAIQSGAISGRGYKGVMIRFAASAAVANAKTIMIQPQYADGTYPAAGNGWSLGANITSSARFATFTLYPTIPTSTTDNANQRLQAYLPDSFKISYQQGDATSVTFTLDYQLLP